MPVSIARVACVLPATLLSLFVLGSTAHAARPNFIEFESGLVRPLALSPDGTRLFATNTPDNTLEIFAVSDAGLTLQARVPVGLEPVAVAARNNTEVWVVNHLSDSVSVVSLTGTPRVVATLLVGDEPRDIVFAGNPQRAFITTAHRGQHRTDASLSGVSGAGDPQLTTPGVDRADVWIFDPANLGTNTALGGRPLRIMTFFTDTPRALAVSPDRNTVYVAGFRTGNQTTAVNEGRICPNFDPHTPCILNNGAVAPGGQLGPATNFKGEKAPFVAMIVKFNRATGHWEDEIGRVWDSAVKFNLPDRDVFAINANTFARTATYAHVGTTLFNMATNPVTGRLYVSNSEARNEIRFEGPGIFGGSTVQGHLAEMRITVISGNTVTPIHLNKHINYAVLASDRSFDATQAQHSLSTPTDIVVSRDGRTLYVAAFGSSKIGVFDTAALESNTFNPRLASANYLSVSGGGPAGLALDESRNRLYVLTRFDNAVKVINLGSRTEIQRLAMHNPEPQSVVEGRRFLYEPAPGGNGEASCASCHIFGDKDELAWDLGNPDEEVTRNPTPINLGNAAQLGLLLFGTPGQINGTGQTDVFHPMKGPMTTQTLRGLRNAGAMHWRGDRANGFFGIDPFDEVLSFNNFIVAFAGLLGGQMPTPNEMQKFTDFQLQVVLPPNPVRALDNSLTAAQQAGRDFFFGPRPSDGINLGSLGMILGTTAFTCEGCHNLNPAEGFFGTGKRMSFEGIQQIFKIPHLRNMYDKVGMFGFPRTDFFNNSSDGHQGDQVRGFGFTNEGTVDTLFRFFNAKVFNPTLNSGFPLLGTNTVRRNVEQFMLAFDSDLAPIVGQQITLTRTNGAAVAPRIELLKRRAAAPFVSKILGGATTECDLVAKVAIGGRIKGYLYDPVAGNFIPDDAGARWSDAALRALAGTAGQEVTYTCVPPGSGERIALGR